MRTISKGISRISRTNWRFRFPYSAWCYLLQDEMKEPTYSLIEYVSIFRCLWPFSNRKERNNSNKLHHINSLRIKHFSLAQSSSPERIKVQIEMQIMPKVKLQEFCWYVNKHRDGNERNIYTSAYKFIIRTILTSMEWNCTVNGNKDAVFVICDAMEQFSLMK